MPRTGRPRSFNRDAALQSAMHLFWQYGYEGSSLERLRRVMGDLSSASFYAAFRSKEALYREALAGYLATHGQAVASLRDRSLPSRERIEQALRRSARMQTETSHPLGCMVTLSATICSEDGAAIQELTSRERATSRQAIRECIETAVDTGDLKSDTDVDGLTTLFDGILVGLSLLIRDGVPHGALEAAITAALTVWDQCRRKPVVLGDAPAEDPRDDRPPCRARG